MVAKAGPGTGEDSGFNEKELEDIMSEIESLEAEFDDTASEEVESASGPESVSEEVEAAPVVAKMVPAAPVAKPVSKKVVQEQAPAPVKKVAPMQTESGALMPAQMEFHVQGEMQLNLKFHVGGTWVQLVANSEEGLVIEMPGGMRFIVPVEGIAQKNKKAS